MVRSEGLLRIRDLELPLLRQAAVALPGAVVEAWPVEVENLLRSAVSRLGGGNLQKAAELTLGLGPGMRDSAAADRRKLAARSYDLSVERFRKSQEGTVLAQVAEQVCWIAGAGARGAGGPGSPLLAPHLQHRLLRIAGGGCQRQVVLHVHPAELLRSIDVVVSPSNTHFDLPQLYKASVAASLRRAAAVHDAAGDVVEDPLNEALLDWRREHGLLTRPARPGVVAATGSGALAERGVRRIYHAAVAVPRPGTNEYDTTPQDVAEAVGRALKLMSRESGSFDPPLRSVCFPLLGSGRGGLPVEASVSALWSVIAGDGDPAREVHLIVRKPAVADLLVEMLGAELLPANEPVGCTARPTEGGVPA